MDTLFSDYENMLIGRTGEIGTHNFWGTEKGGANQMRAVICVRYAIENVLEWTPDEALAKFDSYIIRFMKLTKILQYIRWPDDIENGDPKYLLSLIYPWKIKIRGRDKVIEVFRGVLETGQQFPREYFNGITGFKRYCICLKIVATEFHQMSSTQEIYEFFSSQEGRAMLLDCRLLVPAEHMGIDLYNCIRAIAPKEHGQFWYSFYCFRRAFRLMTQEPVSKRKRRKKDKQAPD